MSNDRLERRQAEMKSRQLGLDKRPADTQRPLSVREIAEMSGISEDTARRIYENEPGVINYGTTDRRKLLRIPRSVIWRVEEGRTVGGGGRC